MLEVKFIKNKSFIILTKIFNLNILQGKIISFTNHSLIEFGR